MSLRRVGPALRDALKHGAQRERGAVERGGAIGTMDAEILTYLSHHPCSIRTRVADGLSTSRATVDWHVRKLLKSGIIACRETRGHGALFLTGMLREGEHELFAMLSNPGVREAFVRIAEKEGVSQEELAASLGASRQTVAGWLRNLRGAEALHIVRDGRTVRYYPSELIVNGADEYSRRRKAFLEATLSKFSSLGLKATVVRSELHVAHIILEGAAGQIPMRLGINPYVTALWSDKEL